jgi:two-component system chemotaxis sensor kinase CheA
MNPQTNVGELVIAQFLVIQDADLRAVQSQRLSRNLAQLGHSTNGLPHIAMSLRMVPIRASFQKMTRLVRDVAAKAGKQVEVRLSGESTESDHNLIGDDGAGLNKERILAKGIEAGLEAGAW